MALKTKWALTKTTSYSCPMPGVFRAVAFSKGVVVLFHSPKGCVHIASTLDIGSQYRNIADGFMEDRDAVPLISSDMREKDTIFGGTDRLRKAIDYAVETYHPKCLVLAVSCVAGIIGDDVEAVAEEAEADYGIPVLASTAAGFLGGEYGTGYEEMANAIVTRFFKKQEHVPGRVLLLGDQMGAWGQYATEVKEILAWFGLKAQWQFPGFVPFDEWKDIPSASLSVILGGIGTTNQIIEKLADRISDEFGVPVLGHVYPVGWENTCAFIRAVAAYAGQKEKGEELIKEKEKEISHFVDAVRHVTEGKKAVIGIGREASWYDPSDTVHTVQHLHMDITGVILYDNLSDQDRTFMTEKIKALTSAPVVDMKTGEALLKEADLLLTTNELMDIGTKQLFIPMIPLVGAGGAMQMLRAVYRQLCRYGNKGGIAYV